MYHDLLSAYLANGSPVMLYRYTPGAALSYEAITYAAVTKATNTEITIAGLINVTSVSPGQFLTLPPTSGGNDSQALHLHTDTSGAIWR